MNRTELDAFAPVTDEIGFVDYEPELVRDWLARQRADDVTDVTEIDGNIAVALTNLLPLTIPRRRFLIAPTVSGWGSVFDNGSRGTEAEPIVLAAADELGCRAVRATSIEDTFNGHRGRFGAAIFTLVDGRVGDWPHTVRVVYAVNDGGRWVFEATGEPQPFEDQDAYRSVRIKDRFPPDRVWRYVESMGLRPRDPDFYVPDRLSWIVSLQEDEDIQELTLDEARAGW